MLPIAFPPSIIRAWRNVYPQRILILFDCHQQKTIWQQVTYLLQHFNAEPVGIYCEACTHAKEVVRFSESVFYWVPSLLKVHTCKALKHIRMCIGTNLCFFYCETWVTHNSPCDRPHVPFMSKPQQKNILVFNGDYCVFLCRSSFKKIMKIDRIVFIILPLNWEYTLYRKYKATIYMWQALTASLLLKWIC